MTDITRRKILLNTVISGSAYAGSSFLRCARAWAQSSPWQPEPGARLSLLRWKTFVQSEDEAFVALLKAFTAVTGVSVLVSRESFDDVQPKASVAANIGAGPDLFWGLSALPHLFASRCVDVSDVAQYLGDKYGGWAPAAASYGTSYGKWISIPVCFAPSQINYRLAASKAAGFSKFPATTDEFLEYARAMKRNNTAGGFALGHAPGDATSWALWCLWAFGGNLVDRNDRVIINSPETEQALEYAKQLYETMVPGVTAWNDSSNNKSFLGREIFWTNNGISIYAAARADPSKNDIAEDMDHSAFPVGPVGRPIEYGGCFSLLAMNYTKYPQACKALMAFILEAENFNKYLEASAGYLTHFLNAYDANPVWTADPKRVPFGQALKRAAPISGVGSMGEQAAKADAEFLIVDMFAIYCAGRESARDAMKSAERQAQRIYR